MFAMRTNALHTQKQTSTRSVVECTLRTEAGKFCFYFFLHGADVLHDFLDDVRSTHFENILRTFLKNVLNDFTTKNRQISVDREDR